MNLTRAELEAKAKPRFEIVDVDGFGKIGIRSCSQLKDAQRQVSRMDLITGQIIPEEHAKSPVHKMIDQLMVDENTPMFTDDDIEQLLAWDAGILTPIFSAIDKFNGPEVKNG